MSVSILLLWMFLIRFVIQRDVGRLQAIQPDYALPLQWFGPPLTATVKGYAAPDGDYIDTTRTWNWIKFLSRIIIKKVLILYLLLRIWTNVQFIFMCSHMECSCRVPNGTDDNNMIYFIKMEKQSFKFYTRLNIERQPMFKLHNQFSASHIPIDRVRKV